jgi:hypothetical protein
MWIFRAALAAALLLPTPLAAIGEGMDSPDGGLPAFDQGGLKGADLREVVEDYEQLLDDLARETRRLDKPAHDALLKSLKLDYNLGDQVDDMRHSLDDNEAIIEIQEAIKDAEERKLLGLQSDLISAVAGLRQRLAGELKDLAEAHRLDLKAWLMVNAGQLRHKREDAEALARSQPPVEPAPIDAAGISPVAQADPGSPTTQAPTPPVGAARP